MGKISSSVYHWDLGPFKHLTPCFCYEDPYKDCTYHVTTKTGSTYYGYRGAIIKNIRLECSCCGKVSRNDVEYLDVYENDVKF